MKLLSSILGALALAFAGAAAAQTASPVATPASITPGQAICFGAVGQPATCVDASHPLPVTGGGGGGGGTAPSAGVGSTSPTTRSPGSAQVVTGNQSYTVGNEAPLNLTPTGRLKVGVSAATNVTPASIPATTLESDLVGCQYQAAPPTWSDTWTGALRCDGSGALAVSLPSGSASALATIASNTAPSGVGVMSGVPAGSTNGTALGSLPAGGKGARFYLGAADSITFTVATSAPSSAPSSTFMISGASGGTGPNWDENLSGTAMIYITATSGSPKFRWF